MNRVLNALLLVLLALVCAAVLITGLVVTSTRAFAQQPPQCGPYATVVAQLEGKYDERRMWGGIGPNGQLVELFVQPDGSTWTFLVSMPDGGGCLVASGEDWFVPPAAPQPSGTEG